mgnify:CR=1 FL=1
MPHSAGGASAALLFRVNAAAPRLKADFVPPEIPPPAIGVTIRESDFSGRGTEGGRADGTPGAPPEEILAYVSGLTAEELASAWRDMVMGSRPPVHATTNGTTFTMLAWILLFGALAMRSSRWRLA